MCGRYLFDDEKNIAEVYEILQEIHSRIDVTGLQSRMKSGEIFPTTVAPVITSKGYFPMIWGFPKWDNSGAIINARRETVLTKNMFRKSILTRRCVIPSTGFFEWKAVDGQKKKDKYLINRDNSRMLYMAGFYNFFKDEGGIVSPNFVILTTAANASMQQIHNRMPVILDPIQYDAWMRDACDIDGFIDKNEPPLILTKVSSF